MRRSSTREGVSDVAGRCGPIDGVCGRGGDAGTGFLCSLYFWEGCEGWAEAEGWRMGGREGVVASERIVVLVLGKLGEGSGM